MLRSFDDQDTQELWQHRRGLTVPLHAGTTLREEFLKPLGLSITSFAIALRVDPARIHAIVQGKRAITADTALRLLEPS